MPLHAWEAGWVVQMASVVARTRGILRRCAPQDDNMFVILSGTTWSEESRACAIQQPPPLRGGSVPLSGQSEAGGTGAQCAPLRGGSHSPPCCNSKWVEPVLRNPFFTREARPKGKGVDSQEGENRRLSPSCPQCGRVGRVPARWERAVPLRLSRRYPRRNSQVHLLAGPLRQRLTALPPPLKGEAGWMVQMASVVARTRGILRFTLFRSE